MHDWKSEVRARLAPLRLRPEREADIVDEIAQHLAERYREATQAGASPDEATHIALAEFQPGNALAQRIAALRDSSVAARAQVFWTAMVLNTLLGVLGALVLWFCAGLAFGDLIRLDAQLRAEALRCIPWLALAIPVATLSSVLQGALQGRELFLSLNAISAASSMFFQLVPLGAALLWGADLLVRKQKLLKYWKHIIVPLVPMAAFVAVLVMLEPDLGTTIVTMSVVLTLLWVVGTPMRVFGVLLTGVLVLGSVVAVAEPYRLRRLLSFTDPCGAQHRLHDGFQACQGLQAMTSGGLFGRA